MTKTATNVAVSDDFEMSDEELAGQSVRAGSEKAAQQDAIVEGRTVDLSTLSEAGLSNGRCPHCGEPTEVEGVMSADELLDIDYNDDDGQQTAPTREFTCNACGGEWGPEVAKGALAEGPRHQGLPKSGLDGSCPHCEVSTRNGSDMRVTEYHELSPGSQRDTVQQYTCNECAGEWGPVVDKPKTTRRKSGSSNGLKIEQNRETRNGVTRPSIGGKCRAVWDALDDHTGQGHQPSAAEARAMAEQRGFDKTTTMVQFYRWRKFNGITGRQG